MAGSEVVQRTPAQQLVAQVRTDQFKEQVAMALPPAVTPEKFVRVATTAIMTNPDIAKLDHSTVLRAMVQAAADGLMPDGKEAAIVGRGGKASYTPMIGGYRKIAAEHGWQLRTAVVYANDEFDHAVVDGEETITHRPVRPGADRGDLVAAYAIARHRDGRRVMTVLHPDDVAKRRKSASTQQVWNEHPAAMWEKSAGRDLFAQLGLADTDLVDRVLSRDVDAHEATEALYGPHDSLPTARQIAAPSSSLPTGGDQGGGSQQAGDAPTDPGASPAPGGSDDEPALEGEPPVLNADEEAIIQAAANEAAIFVLDRGKHRDKTLGEIAQVDGSDSWFVWALRQNDLPAPLAQAVWSYCRVYKPALFNQVLAEREAAAA